MSQTIQTPLTKIFGIKHPIFLAGMNQAAGVDLVAAVTNNGGLGVLGGVSYKPKQLRAMIHEIKELLVDKNAPFGIDLLLPQVGGSARKTNTDYTGGKLNELLDVIIEEKAALFVSAVGVPPKEAVDRLHKAGIPVMNMVGSPKHVQKALDVGVDMICAQGGEGGGHTGEIGTAILIPACVDACKGKMSPLLKCPVYVVAAGGISDGRGLAMALSLGAQGVWVGTRFLATEEGGAPDAQKKATVKAGLHDTHRTTIYTGRPMRVIKNEYNMNWEVNKQAQIKELTGKGIIPVMADYQKMVEKEKVDILKLRSFLCGQVAGNINEIQPCKQVIEEMIATCITVLRENANKIAKL